MSELLRRQVQPGEDGVRLDVLLSGWLEESRSRSQARISGGQVTVDGQALSKSTRALQGSTELVLTPPPRPRPAPPTVEIRYSDDDIAVVVKPSDLVVHDGAGVRGATMVDALQAQGVPLAPGEDPRRPVRREIDQISSQVTVTPTWVSIVGASTGGTPAAEASAYGQPT